MRNKMTYIGLRQKREWPNAFLSWPLWSNWPLSRLGNQCSGLVPLGCLDMCCVCRRNAIYFSLRWRFDGDLRRHEPALLVAAAARVHGLARELTAELILEDRAFALGLVHVEHRHVDQEMSLIESAAAGIHGDLLDFQGEHVIGVKVLADVVGVEPPRGLVHICLHAGRRDDLDLFSIGFEALFHGGAQLLAELA